MEFDPGKVDDAVLAVLYLTLHEQDRAWKGVDWGVLNRLHQAGLIHNPINKSKSVIFTVEGLERARRVAEQLFSEE